MATERKYLSLEKLGLYDQKLKAKMAADDAAALQQSKDYADGLATNYDPAGSAATALADAKTYADGKDAAIAEAKKAGTDAATAAKAADDKAVAAQGTADSLKEYVGTFTASEGVDTVVKYIDAKTANIASDETVSALSARVDQAEKDIDAIEADYLKAADKTELEGKITAAQTAADGAQAHSEGVAASLEVTKTALEAKDAEQQTAIDELKEKIKGVTGAMHFAGVEDSVPTDVSGYAEGDVIIVGEKEFVFNGTEFKEFGDVSAEGERIGTLEGEMDAAQADIEKAKADILANTEAIGKKVEQTAFDEKVAALEGADSALDTRLKAVEGKFGEGEGNVTSQIDTAKNEAIETAAADATAKADKALEDAKAYTDAEVTKDRTRLDALEADAHKHENKELLDTYTQTEENLADAVAKKHAHENKDVLDAITALKVAAWDASEQAAKTYADGLNTAMDARVAAVEEWQANMIEISESEINGLF